MLCIYIAPFHKILRALHLCLHFLILSYILSGFYKTKLDKREMLQIYYFSDIGKRTTASLGLGSYEAWHINWYMDSNFFHLQTQLLNLYSNQKYQPKYHCVGSVRMRNLLKVPRCLKSRKIQAGYTVYTSQMGASVSLSISLVIFLCPNPERSLLIMFHTCVHQDYMNSFKKQNSYCSQIPQKP